MMFKNVNLIVDTKNKATHFPWPYGPLFKNCLDLKNHSKPLTAMRNPQ